MSSRHTSMTLGEVQDLLKNLNKVKNFYHRQIACTSASIREHEKIEQHLSTDEKGKHNIKQNRDYINDNEPDMQIQSLRKKQKINNRFKLRVKSVGTKKT
jgi:hypothetical protein